MSTLMRQVGGQKAEPVVAGSRKQAGAASLAYMAYLKGHDCNVKGSPMEWSAEIPMKGAKPEHIVVWIEPSSDWLASAPIPDFCKAPEGAPL
jgi:hypothetical protein